MALSMEAPTATGALDGTTALCNQSVSSPGIGAVDWTAAARWKGADEARTIGVEACIECGADSATEGTNATVGSWRAPVSSYGD
jgi:hypothetical protein